MWTLSEHFVQQAAHPLCVGLMEWVVVTSFPLSMDKWCSPQKGQVVVGSLPLWLGEEWLIRRKQAGICQLSRHVD